MYIRRDNSNLHFGHYRRHGVSRWLLGVWFVVMVIIATLLWRFNDVQGWALSSIGAAPTPTLDAVTLARMGERAYLQGDLEAAIGYYGEAARLAPQDIDIKFEYGRMLIYRSYAGRTYQYRAGEALTVAQDAVDVAPDNARAQALYCFALMENGRAEEAIGSCLRATQLDPNYAEAHAYLALAYYSAQRPNQAFDEADRAVRLNPNSLDAHRALALSLAYVGPFNAAIQQYEQAIQIHPRLDALYFELAQYYVALSNFDGAQAAFDQVLQMDPDNVKAYTRKCEAFFRDRKDTEAQVACEQAVELDPTYPEAYRQLGMVQYTRRNYEGAIESFETCTTLQDQQGIALADQEIQCYYIRGLAEALLDRCDRAWEDLQSAMAMNPEESIKNQISQGLQMCVTNDEAFSMQQIPTAIPPTAVPPQPIPIY
ncbi:MAG TPA: tetratricopeptide repeat protein [Aggregatilinea sp.]|uniref:tetratricopeptide repeat protein n=1 Tax=Aggregatilinea sp. TaxID=2806333 RepID=UPI002C452609|nr:tetratricopeptide repeat protein [Aggregatilinea sp.]HML20773.1 tetratricopeptide repeat protein [Aggregatilinea sp.]